jgi:hypothetical protein
VLVGDVIVVGCGVEEGYIEDGRDAAIGYGEGEVEKGEYICSFVSVKFQKINCYMRKIVDPSSYGLGNITY